MNNIRSSGKVKIIFLIIPILILIILGVVSNYFIAKFSKLSAQFKNTKSEYERLIKESEALKNKLESDYAKLERDYKNLSQDRDNMLVQIKGLLSDKNRAKELELALEESKKNVERLEQEKQEIQNQNINFKEKANELQEANKQLTSEKEQLTQTLETERAKSFVKKLEQEKTDLQKENSELIDKLKLLQKENEVFKKSSDELGDLKERLDKLNKDYAQALNKNKMLEKNITEAPPKFAEIARQNKILIRQTSNMHYNLGVFYMNQKEYSRAIAEFEKALELTPDDAYSHFNLGYIYAEYIVNREKAIEHFRQYLRLAKKEDKDIDWVKKYLLTWETWKGKELIE